jgi:hypothetical protein
MFGVAVLSGWTEQKVKKGGMPLNFHKHFSSYTCQTLPKQNRMLDRRKGMHTQRIRGQRKKGVISGLIRSFWKIQILFRLSKTH